MKKQLSIAVSCMSSKMTYSKEICPSEPPSMISNSICVRNNEFLCRFSSDFSKISIFVQAITIIQSVKPTQVSSFICEMKAPMSFAQVYPIFRAITKMLKIYSCVNFDLHNAMYLLLCKCHTCSYKEGEYQRPTFHLD